MASGSGVYMYWAWFQLGWVSSAVALDRTWIGGNVDWVDDGAAANWTPADEPDANDRAIYDAANVVNLGSNNEVNGLTLSGGIDLLTNDFDLTVDGLVELVDSNTNFVVGGAGSLILADSVTINNLADLELDGGTVQVIEETGFGLLDINAGGELLGHGTVTMGDGVAANTTLIVNDGVITAQRAPLALLGPPVAGTLSINATDADAHIDLDGAGDSGDVLVRRNQTLDINLPLADIFNGSIGMFQETKLDIASDWTLGALATLDIDNGLVDNIAPLPDVPAGKSTIAGGAFTQDGGAMTVLDADGTLQFDAQFSLKSGTFTNHGHVIFNANAQLTASGTFVPIAGSKITVEANRTLLIAQTSINLDDDNSAPVEYVVNQGGTINLTSTDYDPDVATNNFDGTITLNGGTFVSNTGDLSFVMNGTLNMVHSGGTTANWDGEPLVIGNDGLTLDADVNVSGGGDVNFGTNVTFQSDADVDVADGTNLRFLSASTATFNSVNGGNNAQFTGSGEMSFNGAVNFNEATTFNMPGGTIDFDGADATGNTINVDAPVTINVEQLRSFGKVNLGGTNLLDINNNVGTGTLTVNLDDADAEWTLNGQGVMNLVNDNTEATLLAGNDVNVNGTVNVTGDVRTTARLDIGAGAVVNVNTAGQPLRLGGGTNVGPGANMISGGTITGGGTLSADFGKALQGFGTVNTAIDFVGSASLRATGGTLTLGGAILKVNQIGAETGGVLNVVNPWVADVATVGTIIMSGGTLQGGQVTVNTGNGIQGFGTVTSRVINNSKLLAANGGTLVFETAGNDNDWDGAANNGALQAISGDLEVRDTDPFPFGGTVSASNGHKVYTNGFGLNFSAGSTLNLTQATLQADESTAFKGTVTIGAGSESTIDVKNNYFLEFETGSATTLNANLRLKNNNIIIEQGAAFSGTGAVIIPAASNVIAEADAVINVLFVNEGTMRPAGFNTVGNATIKEYQQTNTGDAAFELIGTLLNEYDRLTMTGVAQLDGYLVIDIDGAFVPGLGDIFNIITASSVVGQFDYFDTSGMPAGLAFQINYLSNAVQLEVVNKTFFEADFDEDGDVDQTDYIIWKNAFGLNQLGDANGDNISDASDYAVWRNQLGSKSGGAGSLLALEHSAVPEPATWALAGLAIAIAGISRRRANSTTN